MTGRIPSRRASLKRVEEHYEKLKDQMGNASDIYDDARDLQELIDPSVGDFQLPESMERLAMESLKFEEQIKAFRDDLEVLDEEALELENARQLLLGDIQSTQLIEEELEEFTKEQLAEIKRVFDADPKLTALVFQDQSLFDTALTDIRDEGNELVIRIHSLSEKVRSLYTHIDNAKDECDERSTSLVNSLLQELGDTKKELEESNILQASADEELARVGEELRTVTETYETSEMALKNELEMERAKAKGLQGDSIYLSTEIQSVSRENARVNSQVTQLQTTLSRQDIQHKAHLEALRETLSQQTLQHDSKVNEMNAENKSLSHKNEKQKAEIELLRDRLREVEERLSQEIDGLNNRVDTMHAENGALQAEKHALSAQNAQSKAQLRTFEADNSALKAEKRALSTQNAQFRDQLHTFEAENGALKAEKHALSAQNSQSRNQLHTFEAENHNMTRQIRELEARTHTLAAEKDDTTLQIRQLESRSHTLAAEKDDMTRQVRQLEARTHTLDTERSGMTRQIRELQARAHTLETERGGMTRQIRELEAQVRALDLECGQHEAEIRGQEVERDELNAYIAECKATIQTLKAEKEGLNDLNKNLDRLRDDLADQVFNLHQDEAQMIDNHQSEVEQLEKDRDGFEDKAGKLQSEMSALSIQHELKEKDLESRLNVLEKYRDEQKQQHSEEVVDLRSDLVRRDNTLQETIRRTNEERTSFLRQIQQLRYSLFSKMPSMQHNRTVSLSASDTRLLFERQQLSHQALANWIQGPLKDMMDAMTSSTETSNLVEMYQLILGSLIYLQSGNLTYLQSGIIIEDKRSLLECVQNFQTWLSKACRERISILGLALARFLKTTQEGPQSDPWFLTNMFDASQIIDSRNSELPITTPVLGDGFTGIILLVQGVDV